MYHGEERLYRRLHILEFDSDRKRMSVIVQFPDESIWLLCKGAESTVLPRCVFGPIPETESHIKDYAMVPSNVDQMMRVTGFVTNCVII
jgi:phospholipid-translocating ATPase